MEWKRNERKTLTNYQQLNQNMQEKDSLNNREK